MTNKLLKIAGALLLGMSLNSYAVVTVLADDWDGTSTGTVNPSGGVTMTTVADPTDAGNMVGQLNFNGGNQWQSLATVNVAIPATVVPGTDTVTFSYRVYIPSAGNGGIATVGTNFGNSDSFNNLVKINQDGGDTYPPSTQNPINGAFPLDQWHTISATGVIPATDNDPVGPTTSTRLIVSIRDISNDSATGLLGYVDDLSITFSESVPEPSSAAFLLLGAAGLVRRKR
ncbi:MAG: PEP-CTERM sorting domain-containing protein [Verrucomicrobiaceae bacterium]